MEREFRVGAPEHLQGEEDRHCPRPPPGAQNPHRYAIPSSPLPIARADFSTVFSG